jgi:hypothetical protein
MQPERLAAKILLEARPGVQAAHAFAKELPAERCLVGAGAAALRYGGVRRLDGWGRFLR